MEAKSGEKNNKEGGGDRASWVHGNILRGCLLNFKFNNFPILK
jgi:hypothetical protein